MASSTAARPIQPRRKISCRHVFLVGRRATRYLKSLNSFLFIIAALLATTLVPRAQDNPRKTVWSGVYAAAQADRGRAVYETQCFECHNGDLDPQNTASRLVGDRFMDRWREDSLGNLFNFVSTSMPRRAPASLTKNAYLDVVSYVLQLNKFPAGSQELSTDVLEGIRVERKEGPKPLPSGALVQLAGCLTVDPDETWLLSNATEPARTRRANDSTPEELKAAETTPLGTNTFRLQNFAYAGDFRPLNHIGEKMLAKGTLIRQTNKDRINLTWLKTIDSNCEP